MIKQTPVFLLSLFLISPTFAVEFDETQTTWETMDVIHENKNSDCASEIFLNALIENGDAVNVGTPEYEVRAWARNVMSEPDVLKKILDCPEIKNTDDYKTIVFTPIEYKFPDDEYGERTITINYSTQPKILKQKLILASKLSLPNGDPNPKLMDPNDPAKYINTDPAWYAIMVVQHDSLKNFIGPNKNNTLSLKWINDNIDSIYPHGYYCTSKSAIANDKDTINKVVKQVVDIDDDTNDYYVAGDVNLEWVMYAEIAAEVALTIATVGGFEAAMVSAKSVRAFKNGKTLVKSMRNLLKFDDVKDYVKIAKQISNHSDDIAKLEKNIKNAKKYEKALEKASKGGKNAEKYRKEAEEILKSAQKIDKNITPEKLKNVDKLTDQRKALQETVKSLEQNAETMAKNSKNVEKYKESAETFADLQKYYKKLRAFKRPQTGNIITRNLKKVGSYAKTIRASQKGADIIGKAGKLGRAGMSSRSAKIGNWLLDSSLRFGTKLARFERDVSLVAGAAAFVGDMYDQTSSTNKDFTNGIEFKPLCLLSADDLAGQENVVNYGMWLMWTGNSTDPADDDAAYLQSMDFAAKFFYELDEFQDENGANCNVDIYIVRPIIRLDETDINNPKGEMFYLFMNEIPWSTAEQFGEQIQDVEDWERNQKTLNETDPQNKYHRDSTTDMPEQNANTYEQSATNENAENDVVESESETTLSE